eukprot:CAMPEP_0115326430 /NCGR_PEP_ID=MMETSP0270-20121206/83569_1 /TAXON_ID=71861 /ORGANISM="Scrippsiella trochoidea, Strain CCMP3099" /LENGTH=162 /DNA_ID=CAMNT_0002746737 /DNA_START=323 /DNA_END=808 /DNA_ORIENTATION=+
MPMPWCWAEDVGVMDESTASPVGLCYGVELAIGVVVNEAARNNSVAHLVVAQGVENMRMPDCINLWRRGENRSEESLGALNMPMPWCWAEDVGVMDESTASPVGLCYGVELAIGVVVNEAARNNSVAHLVVAQGVENMRMPDCINLWRRGENRSDCRLVPLT